MLDAEKIKKFLLENKSVGLWIIKSAGNYIIQVR